MDLPRNGSNGPEFHSSLRRYQRYEELERGRQGCGRWGLPGQQASRHLEWGLGEPAIPLEAQFSEIASYIALVIEAGAVLVVAFGAFQALAAVVVVVVRRAAGEMEGRQIWIRFATLDPARAGICARRRSRAHGRGADLGRHRQARRDRHHPHHAELFPRQGHRRVRPGTGIWRKSAFYLGVPPLIDWTTVPECG